MGGLLRHLALLLVAVLPLGAGIAASPCAPALTPLECRTGRLVEQDREIAAMLVAARAADAATQRRDPVAALAARIRFADLLRLHGAPEAARALLALDAPLAANAPPQVRDDHALALATAEAFTGDYDGAAALVGARLALSDPGGAGALRLKAFRARLAHVLDYPADARNAHAALDADVRRLFGPASLEYARYLTDQASMESSADNDQAALALAERARGLYEARRDRSGENYRFLLNNLVTYMGYQGREEEAVALSRRALPLYERALARRLEDPTADADETQRLLQTFARSALAPMWRLNTRLRSAAARRTLLADALATASAVTSTRAVSRFGGSGRLLAAGRSADARRAAWHALLAGVGRDGHGAAAAVRRLAVFLAGEAAAAYPPGGRAALGRAAPGATLVAQIQRRLESDEALLVLIPATNGGFTIAVTREAADWWETPMSVAAACQAVSALRRAIVAGPAMTCRNARFPGVDTGVIQHDAFDPAAAHQLYRRLVGGAEPILAAKRSWQVLTYDSVASLPFGALVVDDPAAELLPWHRLPWLATRHALTLLPSLAALLDRPEGGARKEGVRATIVAIDATCDTRTAGQDCGAGAAATGAPIGREQLARLIRMGGPASRLLAGRETSRAAVIAAVRRADIVVFAAHATSSAAGVVLRLGGSGAEPWFFGARDLVGMRLHDPVIILGACDTSAIGDRVQGDVLRDLGYGFIAAGSRRLLLTHYRVAGGAAAYIIGQVVGALAAGEGRLSVAEALRRATQALMNDPAARHLTDPAAWSAFFAAGERH